MNYIAPTFHFQQGDELCFQTSVPHQQQQQQIFQDMFVSGPPVTLTDDHQHSSFKLHTVPRRKPVAPPAPQPAAADHVEEDTHTNKKKKIIHRDVERQRRHEMAMLYASLRSLLPLEYLKGKRSISDHMNEAANYIRHQQKKIQELKEKRDGLRRLALSSSSSASLPGKGSLATPSLTVRPCWEGVETVISSELYNGVLLAKVLAALLAEGLDVVRCVSTQVSDEFIYTIQCAVTAGELKRINFSSLEKKLADLIRLGWDPRACGTSSRAEEEICLNRGEKVSAIVAARANSTEGKELD